MSTRTQPWTKEDIQGLLERSDMAVQQAVVRLYTKGQTEDEQEDKTTKHHNGVGFNGADANILSDLAQQQLGIGTYEWKGELRTRTSPKPLSPKQIILARRLVMKYAGQLATMANEKMAAQANQDQVAA